MLGVLDGADLWIVLGVVVLIFGGSQIPKLARSIGSASHEFKKGLDEGAKAAADGDDEDKDGSAKAKDGESKAKDGESKAKDGASGKGNDSSE